MNTARRILPATLTSLAFAALAAAFLLRTATTAFACTPPAGGLPQKTVSDRVAAADVTIEGVILAVSGEANIGNQTATIRVTQYIKGQGAALVTVSGYGSSAFCKSEVSAGQHLLFYIHAVNGGAFNAFYLTQFDATAPADAPTLRLAATAAAHSPTGPNPRTYAVAGDLSRDSGGGESLRTPELAPPGQASDGLPLALAAGAMSLAGLAFVVFRGSRT